MEIKENELGLTYLEGKAVVSITEKDSAKSEVDAIVEACKELTATLPDELKHLKAVHNGKEFRVERKELEDGSHVSEVAFGYELENIINK